MAAVPVPPRMCGHRMLQIVIAELLPPNSNGDAPLQPGWTWFGHCTPSLSLMLHRSRFSSVEVWHVAHPLSFTTWNCVEPRVCCSSNRSRVFSQHFCCTLVSCVMSIGRSGLRNDVPARLSFVAFFCKSCDFLRPTCDVRCKQNKTLCQLQTKINLKNLKSKTNQSTFTKPKPNQTKYTTSNITNL